jgi:hypothetical protein
VPQGIAGIVAAGTGTLETVVVAGNIQVKANGEGGGVRQQHEQTEQVEQAEQVEAERQ